MKFVGQKLRTEPVLPDGGGTLAGEGIEAHELAMGRLMVSIQSQPAMGKGQRRRCITSVDSSLD